ncbi:MAG: hypothetical protein HUK22_05810, partial [Thermoguttaceae bacterium]|nr:hypothetical protein [Thermoguttaceae bacterium]
DLSDLRDHFDELDRTEFWYYEAAKIALDEYRAGAQLSPEKVDDVIWYAAKLDEPRQIELARVVGLRKNNDWTRKQTFLSDLNRQLYRI